MCTGRESRSARRSPSPSAGARSARRSRCTSTSPPAGSRLDPPRDSNNSGFDRRPIADDRTSAARACRAAVQRGRRAARRCGCYAASRRPTVGAGARHAHIPPAAFFRWPGRPRVLVHVARRRAHPLLGSLLGTGAACAGSARATTPRAQPPARAYAPRPANTRPFRRHTIALRGRRARPQLASDGDAVALAARREVMPRGAVLRWERLSACMQLLPGGALVPVP
eukprot:6611563-Prymnesium_polylepis.1